jgi:uncharacterized protein YbjT (DUF2867 family)
MRVLIFGATGMVGQGALRECLLDAGVESVVTIGRTATGQQNAKLREIVHKDLWNYSAVEPQLAGFDACFFCLGVTSAGMNEADYTRLTHGIAAAAAETLARLNPKMTFVFVSGVGADSTETSRTMWARVKGKAENAVLHAGFRGAYVFRPAFIQPLHGIQSRTKVYRVLYGIFRPLTPVLRALFPSYVLTTEEIGKAMLKVARVGAPKQVLEPRDIRALLNGESGGPTRDE